MSRLLFREIPVIAALAACGALSQAIAPPARAASPWQLSIPGEKVYPESITAAADGRVFIGSITKRRIFVVKPGAATADAWTAADNDTTLGVYGVFADDRSQTLWACFSSFPGPHTPPQSASALKAYDLQSGRLKGHYPLPTRGAFCNDIATGRDGAVYVSDSNNMEIDRLRSGEGRLQVWAGNGGFGPKGGVLDGISVIADTLFVNTLATNKVFAVPVAADGSAGAIAEVSLNRNIEAPDGMRSFGKALLLVESGGVGRLARLDITGHSATLATLKEGFPEGPVSVAVVGTTAYVLEGQLKGLFGPPEPNAVAKPFRASAVELSKP